MSVLCSNKGCNKSFNPSAIEQEACKYHSGIPVFHDGRKGWSCCSEGRCESFDDFMNIAPCTTGIHQCSKPTEGQVIGQSSYPLGKSDDAMAIDASDNNQKKPNKKKARDVKIYLHIEEDSSDLQMKDFTKVLRISKSSGASLTVILQEFLEDYNMQIKPSPFLRPGDLEIFNEGGKKLNSENNVIGCVKDGDDYFCRKRPNIEETTIQLTEEELDQVRICIHCNVDYTERKNEKDECHYHSGGPIFHEGAKGWSCCRRSVFDFDEFIKIKPCTVGPHQDVKKGFSKATSIYQWVQDLDFVYIIIPLSGVTKDNCDVTLQNDNVSISMMRTKGSEFLLDLDLSLEIIEKRSKTTFENDEITLKLKKKTPTSWKRLCQ